MKRRYMKKVWITARSAALILFCWSLTASASEQQLPAAGTAPDKKEAAVIFAEPEIALQVPLTSPLFAGVPIADVNGEVITLEELTSTLGSTHEGRTAGEKQAAKVDFSEILKRLINVRLIVQEAREMGMDELPEVKATVSKYSKTAVRELLIEDMTKGVKADEAEVEKFRREMVREWKIKSVFFEKEEDAKKMEEGIKAGKSFEELVAKAVEDKTAKAQGEGGYVKPRDLQPGVAEVVSKMEIGSASPVIQVGSGKNAGFTIMKLEEIRYPEDPETTERARGAVLEAARVKAVKNFKKEASEKTVKVDTKLLNSLDFEAKKPGLQKLLKDKRNVATVKGEKPVTVADLTTALSEKFFHGMERAIEGKQVNAKKYEVLDKLLEKRLFEKEESKRDIEKSEKFKAKVKEYEDSVLFGVFVQKVLIPEVKVTDEDSKAYHNAHAGDYTTPEMMKVSSLVFETQEQAESALERLKKGADFNWIKSNTEGQVDSSTPGFLSFTDTPLIIRTLPQGVQKALSGAKPEEFRLYESPEGLFYVLYVRNVTPPALRPFEEAKEEIAKKVFNEKLNASVAEWAGKLKDSADVKIYMASPASSGEKTGNH